MRFFSSSALLVLGLAATPAYARIRVGRRLQDPAPAAPAAPAEHTAAPAAAAPVQKELPACKENFPPAKYEKSGTDPFSFEAHKEAPFYKRTLAELAPCLLVEGDCGGSVWKVDVLTGALATLTQQVFDTTKAAEAAAAAPAAAPAHADAAAPAAPAADGQKQDAAPPAVPAGENAAPATPAEAHPEGHNATTAAHPEGHNATTEAKPADHPATEHPTGEHPATEHPTGEHPAAEHNATAHAAGEHPATEQPAAEHPATEHPAAAHPEGHNATTAAHPEGHNATTAAHPEGHNATAAATPAVVGGVDLTKFTEALSSSELMKTVLNEHAPCVAQQPGGVDGFIKDYAKAVHGFIAA